MASINPKDFAPVTSVTGTDKVSVYQDGWKSATAENVKTYVVDNTTPEDIGAATADHNHDGVYEPADSNIQTHIADTSNPHATTAEQVGADAAGAAAGAIDAHNLAFTHADIAHTNRAALNAVSGINTGDETASTIKTKLGVTTLSGTNTGDQDLSGLVPTSRTVNGKALSSNITLSASDVGAAGLDESGKVPASQLPSYVDDVLEYADATGFPPTGETGKIYIALNTNLTYRWSGSGYVEISQSLALGETSSTAYRGDRGATAYTHSQATGNPHSTTASDVGAVPTTRTVNSKALSGDISLTYSDVGADASGAASGAIATHEGTYAHADIAHSNRTALDAVSGNNTGDQLTFKTISVSGQSDVVADSTTDTLTLVAGTNVTLTTDASTDTITIAAAGGGGTGVNLGVTYGVLAKAYL